jgi:hypothetical protein
MKPLRVGLLVDGVIASKYVHELVLWAKGRPGIVVSHLIVHGPNAPGRANAETAFQKRFAGILFRLMVCCERLLLKILNRPYADHHRRLDLRTIVGEIVEIEPVDRDGGKAFAKSVATMKTSGLDLLIQCGSTIPHADVLRASRLGAVCLGDADGQCIPGSAAGFWECYHKAPQTAFSIRSLPNGSEEGQVLLRGSFRTLYYFSLNQAQLCRKAYSHFRNLLDRIAVTGRLPEPRETASAYSFDRPHSGDHPGLIHCIVYAVKITQRILTRILMKLLRVRERWGISFLRGSWNKADFSQGNEASLPKGRFWADPFLWSQGGKTFCLVEDLVYKANRAHITALELDGTNVIERGIALKEPFHLSFPFLFQYKNELYMCPETAESRQIRIYRCVEFPLKWTLHRVVMNNVSAVDTIFFERAGRWWMLTSIDQSQTNDYGSELYLFSANSPLETAWVPHPQNPVKLDARGGRNAGLIIEGDKLFRVAQIQGFDQYGKGLLVYEIKAVSDSTYVEERVAEIDPTFRRGIVGTHHLCTDGRTTVFDHLAHSFVF